MKMKKLFAVVLLVALGVIFLVKGAQAINKSKTKNPNTQLTEILKY
jgi:uncharacterized membrane protein YphA (DoxX/SURF4 family)